MKALHIRLECGVTLAAPARLSSITSFVLLEQEAWFEKEVDFLLRWLKPGMTAIDIGANLGVYSLPMAKCVGPAGQVYAYEPGGEARALLAGSRGLNGASNLHIFSKALSDHAGQAKLVFGESGELNALGNEGAGEDVTLTTLDIEDAARGWQSPDFVKIDAEGAEASILDGGREFFARHSPLILFEVKVGLTNTNEGVQPVLRDMGYGLYRSLPGAPMLVPVGANEALDKYELNLFAAKPDRALSLKQGNFLADDSPTPAFNFEPHPAIDPVYQTALAACALWHDGSRSAAERYGALNFAYQTLVRLCDDNAPVTMLATLARAAFEMGRRGHAVSMLEILLQKVRQPHALMEPFWPACPRYEGNGANPAEWFVASVVEQYEKLRSFSAFFAPDPERLVWLSQQPHATSEIERRLFLTRQRLRQRADVPARLFAPGNLNADIWRALLSV